MPLVVMGESEYYTDEADKIVLDNNIFDAITFDIPDDVRGVDADIQYQYRELLNRLRDLEPDFASTLESMNVSDTVKIVKIRSYLGRKAFDAYKEMFMNDLQERSAQTNRKIKTGNWKYGDKYWDTRAQNTWLDRGELDEPKCHIDNDVNNYGICFYPDDFEDVYLYLQETDQKDNTRKKSLSGNNFWGKNIFFHKDMLDKNAAQNCWIDMQYTSDNREYDKESNLDFNENVFISTNCDVEKYDEYHAHRNQEIADTINGKHDVIAKEKQADGRVLIVERQNEDMSAWKSNDIPDAWVISHMQSWQQNIQKRTYETQ